MSFQIRIVREKIAGNEMKKCAEETFGDMVKVVVDIDRNLMTVGGELHAREVARLGEVVAGVYARTDHGASSLKQLEEFCLHFAILARCHDRK